MRIAKEGLRFIGPGAVLSALFFWLGWWPAGTFFLIFTAALLFFFRDPGRMIPAGENLLVSPADGKVVKIETGVTHPWLNTSATCVSVFLSLLDVHLTRSPLSGKVIETEYKPGRFFRADKDEAGRENESNSLLVRGPKTTIVVKQIVGLAARRIKCFVRKGDAVSRGQKIGLMYFGSRIDIYLPQSVFLTVGLEGKVRAGETVIGEIPT